MKELLKKIFPASIYDAEKLSENARTVAAALLAKTMVSCPYGFVTQRAPFSKWVTELSRRCQLDENSVMESLMELAIKNPRNIM